MFNLNNYPCYMVIIFNMLYQNILIIIKIIINQLIQFI